MSFWMNTGCDGMIWESLHEGRCPDELVSSPVSLSAIQPTLAKKEALSDPAHRVLFGVLFFTARLYFTGSSLDEPPRIRQYYVGVDLCGIPMCDDVVFVHGVRMESPTI